MSKSHSPWPSGRIPKDIDLYDWAWSQKAGSADVKKANFKAVVSLYNSEYFKEHGSRDAFTRDKMSPRSKIVKKSKAQLVLDLMK